MKNTLIDSDVLLDFFFDRKPFSDNAERVLFLCESGAIRGYITPVICSNVYYLLRQTASHHKVVDKLKMLFVFMEVTNIEKSIILQALNSTFSDFEDALQNYAALQTNFIDIIITRNIKDYKKSSLGIYTPEEFLKLIDHQNAD